MTARRRFGLATVVAAVAISGCTEVESTTAPGYEPAKLHEVDGSDVKQVTLTAEGAERAAIRTAHVRRSGDRRIVPYPALIYDGAGRTFVYTVPQPRSFVRAAVVVDRIDGDRVLLSDGPAAGSQVVTTGAAEVYGSELEIAGSH